MGEQYRPHTQSSADQPQDMHHSAQNNPSEPNEKIVIQKVKKPAKLDKTTSGGVETTPPAKTTMGIEGERKEQERAPQPPQQQVKETIDENVPQQVIYEVKKLPPGVNAVQLDFLAEASEIKAFKWLKPETAKIIAEYFTSERTYKDIAQEYGISKQAVRDRINRGLTKLRYVLYSERPELRFEDKYPIELIKKGKDNLEVHRSERSRMRSSESQRNRPSNPPTQMEQNVDIFITKPSVSEKD
ncbi:sigma factor-like helix-turn-helix DNA-binding protein [Dictyobacter formicarum]|uniref:RNA polymerase sigma-70 region 4 domain-containing protein n=1 Tax=Dictyobacter formicarum TaxID=2778368 RepID=A0ABQ3VJ76_9CHLR|nr:sigma factor-like helix-turn-helix DNA-binding protein [Dictyobacter formicarum]GHO85186.1 hypothetical protein KSZ_31920 [Dictyobacter formicarum]